MHEFIQTSGYEASVASSAEEALDLLSVNTLEVVITDIMLPGMDGLELTDRIKRDHEIDVIVMTGYSTEYSYEEAISKGASDFVFKPVRFEELLLRLKRVLNERRLNQERVHMLEKLKNSPSPMDLPNYSIRGIFTTSSKGRSNASTATGTN
jgi:two-component system cell cycle response regulator